MIALFIDTTSNKEIIVRLSIDEKVFEEKREVQNNRTQIVLPLIEELLQKHHLTPQEIEKVTVNPIPGSFTGVRVGAAIANALIFSLGLPENLVEPTYT